MLIVIQNSCEVGRGGGGGGGGGGVGGAELMINICYTCCENGVQQDACVPLAGNGLGLMALCDTSRLLVDQCLSQDLETGCL